MAASPSPVPPGPARPASVASTASTVKRASAGGAASPLVAYSEFHPLSDHEQSFFDQYREDVSELASLRSHVLGLDAQVGLLRQQVLALVDSELARFHAAATRIQARWRGFTARKRAGIVLRRGANSPRPASVIEPPSLTRARSASPPPTAVADAAPVSAITRVIYVAPPALRALWSACARIGGCGSAAPTTTHSRAASAEPLSHATSSWEWDLIRGITSPDNDVADDAAAAAVTIQRVVRGHLVRLAVRRYQTQAAAVSARAVRTHLAPVERAVAGVKGQLALLEERLEAQAGELAALRATVAAVVAENRRMAGFVRHVAARSIQAKWRSLKSPAATKPKAKRRPAPLRKPASAAAHYHASHAPAANLLGSLTDSDSEDGEGEGDTTTATLFSPPSPSPIRVVAGPGSAPPAPHAGSGWPTARNAWSGLAMPSPIHPPPPPPPALHVSEDEVGNTSMQSEFEASFLSRLAEEGLPSSSGRRRGSMVPETVLEVESGVSVDDFNYLRAEVESLRETVDRLTGVRGGGN
ncbi:hypothetical protein H9P43_006913 [Blastocladiella emersonii ATCC 22665]|nr:hypothetical protein H9P43_006913 [Blastocladiella emersonii ATCC 22665]